MIGQVRVWGSSGTDYVKSIRHILKSTQYTRLDIYGPEEWEIPLNTHEDQGKLKKLIEDSKKEINFIVGAFDTPLYHEFSTFHYPKNAKVHFWPTFFIHRTHLDLGANKLINNDLKIRKIFLSLNNKAHPHRCVLMDCLHRKNLFDEGYITWHEPHEGEYRYWTPKRLTLDKEYLTTLRSDPINEFNTTFMSLIAESTILAHFITEKTFLAMFAKKPFLIAGPPGIHRYLAELGFKLYDEVFDYRFDDIEDIEDRYDILLENIERLKGKKLNKIYQKLLPKIRFNYGRLFEIMSDPKFVPEIVKKTMFVPNADQSYNWIADSNLLIQY